MASAPGDRSIRSWTRSRLGSMTAPGSLKPPFKIPGENYARRVFGALCRDCRDHVFVCAATERPSGCRSYTANGFAPNRSSSSSVRHGAPEIRRRPSTADGSSPNTCCVSIDCLAKRDDLVWSWISAVVMETFWRWPSCSDSRRSESTSVRVGRSAPSTVVSPSYEISTPSTRSASTQSRRGQFVRDIGARPRAAPLARGSQGPYATGWCASSRGTARQTSSAVRWRTFDPSRTSACSGATRP